MMWRYHDGACAHAGYSGWWFFALFVVVLLAVAVAVLLLTQLRSGRPWAAPATQGRQEALEILRRRYAAGEIDDEEFRRRSATLDGPTS